MPKRNLLLFIGLVSTALVLRGVFFYISVANVPATTDEAIVFLMAKHIAAGQLYTLVMSQPYNFPFESYALAPFYKLRLLSNTEWGVRIIPFLVGLIELALFLLILRRCCASMVATADKTACAWPAALWLLFPSAYLLMQQSAYRIPVYTPLSVFSLLAMLSALSAPKNGWIVLCGLAGGLAFSSTMIALPVVVATAIYVVSTGVWQRFWQRLLFYLTGLGLGLLPFFAGRWHTAGAYRAVSGKAGWHTIWQRMQGGALKQAVASALGIEPNVFPDEAQLQFIPLLKPFIFYIWLILLGAFLILRLWQAIVQWRADKHLRLMGWDVFWIIAVLNLAIAVASVRFDSHSVRYLLPMTWSFPFVVTGICALLAQRAVLAKTISLTLKTTLVLLAAFNIFASACLIKAWRDPEFTTTFSKTPDLAPVMAFLAKHNFSHCVAPYWVAYRINFIADEKILCAQPQNERFPGWQLPYKEAVDSATNVAYVLTDLVRFLTPNTFERHMRIMGITSCREDFGAFKVYHDFRPVQPVPTKTLPASMQRISTSHSMENAGKLADNCFSSRWSSGASQNTNMWVQVDLPSFLPVCRLTMHYGEYERDAPLAIDILAHTAHGWEKVVGNCAVEFDKFAMQNGHPVYGISARQTIAGGIVEADALRIQINRPRHGRFWTMTELAVAVAAGQDAD